MAVKRHHKLHYSTGFRDVRPFFSRMADAAKQPVVATCTFAAGGVLLFLHPWTVEIVLTITFLYVWWLKTRGVALPLKLPAFLDLPDPNNVKPNGEKGKAEGIVYLGTVKGTGEELWLSNSDARTHMLYLGTTGAGKTEGLKSIVTNALTWGSGFIYVDGKADTDLWASLYALARRFGRDDDLLLLNYMTGNTDGGAPSNSLNPFSSGSASYLTNLMVGLMDEAGGDNAMWKGRAISMMSSLMPALTYKRNNLGMLLDVGVVRDHLSLQAIVRLSRVPDLPDRIKRGLASYLETLPGYVDFAFDDEGREKPPSPEDPPFDISVPLQQHGYLSMQFTRALQSLSDEYGYIFQTQLADIDMLDVVLNRRILVVLIPALEKSDDEAANLGKIIAATIKGMMGSTLGASVEGDWQGVIENKPTRAASPFMTVFDEVGYYTAQGMAVMAAQARSLGFSLIFAGQDLPAMEKRVKQEARSITANCNLKLFGKLEDSTDTLDFFERTVGKTFVGEASGFSQQKEQLFQSYHDRLDASITEKPTARYGELKEQKEGEVHMVFRTNVLEAKLFYAAPKKVPGLRVQKFLGVSPDEIVIPELSAETDAVLAKLTDARWRAADAPVEPMEESPEEIAALARGLFLGDQAGGDSLAQGALAVAQIADLLAEEEAEEPTTAEMDEAAETALAPADPLAAAQQSETAPPEQPAAPPDTAATEPAIAEAPAETPAEPEDNSAATASTEAPAAPAAAETHAATETPRATAPAPAAMAAAARETNGAIAHIVRRTALTQPLRLIEGNANPARQAPGGPPPLVVVTGDGADTATPPVERPTPTQARAGLVAPRRTGDGTPVPPLVTDASPDTDAIVSLAADRLSSGLFANSFAGQDQAAE